MIKNESVVNTSNNNTVFVSVSHSMHTLLRLGRESEFWNFEFLAEVKIFLISGGRGYICPMRRVGLFFLGEGQFILHPFSRFEMKDFKNLKIFA